MGLSVCPLCPALVSSVRRLFPPIAAPLSSHRSQRHPPRGSESRLAELQVVVHSGSLLHAGHYLCR
jgi:hypothetical protein